MVRLMPSDQKRFCGVRSVMRSNAEQFRKNARGCVEQAIHGNDLNVRLFYLDLHEHWTFLAQQEERLQRDQQFDQDFRGLECGPSLPRGVR